MLVKPDRETNCQRFGVIAIGDGLSYQACRAGIGKRGYRMIEIVSRYGEEDIQTPERFRLAEELFHLSLGVFYSEERLNQILDDGCFGFDELGALMRIVTDSDAESVADDADKKKQTSSDSA